jgi:23S rRNA pseudouridine1911/1915/1917 synthase
MLDIIYEDADVLVVNKPAGLLTSTVPRERRPTLLAAVREHVERRHKHVRVGLIHRLDRDAGGLLVFSKNNAAYRSLKTQFFHHSVKRVYTAVVIGKPEPVEGKIQSRLVERADGTVYSTRKPTGGEKAVTFYRVIDAQGSGNSVLEVTLETGRKHQVRVHLAERGWPILGDPVYERKHPNGLHLAATTLAFVHPRTKKQVQFSIMPKFYTAPKFC